MLCINTNPQHNGVIQGPCCWAKSWNSLLWKWVSFPLGDISKNINLRDNMTFCYMTGKPSVIRTVDLCQMSLHSKSHWWSISVMSRPAESSITQCHHIPTWLHTNSYISGITRPGGVELHIMSPHSNTYRNANSQAFGLLLVYTCNKYQLALLQWGQWIYIYILRLIYMVQVLFTAVACDLFTTHLEHKLHCVSQPYNIWSIW